MVKWISGYESLIAEALVRLNEAMTIKEDGGISFQGWGAKENISVLSGLLEYHPDVPSDESNRMTRSAVFDAAKQGKLQAGRILTEAKRSENNFINGPYTRYVLTSSISLGWFHPYPRLYHGNTQIILEPWHSRKFRDGYSKLLDNAARQSIDTNLPGFYSAVRVHVSGRSIFEAGEKALDALNTIRAILNLYENSKLFTQWRSGPPKPVNKILLGPLHFLHYPDGSLAAKELWWFESSYRGEMAKFQPSQNEQSDVLKFYFTVKDRLSKCKYRSEMERILLRYVKSLDEPISQNSFLKLWGVLEQITNTQKNSYATTIERASYIFEDREFEKFSLDTLRNHRNRLVHEDFDNPDLDAHLFRLKYYVEKLIVFHLFNNFGFESLQEVGSFLSQPRDEVALDMRIKLANNAKKFLRKKI